MGQAGFTIAGQVVGAYFGGPAGAMVGGMIGSAIGGALFPTDLGRKEGPRLSDLRSQVSTYGASVPVVYGRCGLAGCVIWAADLREVMHEEDIGTKGGPATEGTAVTYSYYASFAVAICAGEMASLSRIWINGKCFYDVRDEADGEAIVASAAFAKYFTWYPGSETQEPDPTLEAALGAANVPAYRGVCYLVFNDLPLELVHNAPIAALNCQFEVTRVGAPYIGIRQIESADGLSSYMIYPVADGGGTLRIQLSTGKTGVYTLSGDPLSVEAPTEEESGWPLAAAGAGADGTRVIGRMADGSIARTYVAGTAVSNPIFKLYAAAGSSTGGHYDAVSLLDPASTFQGSVPCADLQHICVFTSVGAVFTYSILKWNGAPIGWTLESTGSTVSPSQQPLGCAGQGLSSSGCMESDLLHVWMITGAASPPVIYCYEIDPDTGDMTLFDSYTSSSSGSYSADGSKIWADAGMAWAIWASAGYYRAFTRITGTAANAEDLAQVVTDISERCTLTAGQIDVTDLAGIAVDGFMWAGVTPGRAALEHLRRVYWFDSVESEGKIKFILRGGDPVDTITADELGAFNGGDPPLELVATERADEDTLPAFLSVSYLTKDADYQPGVQSAQRSATVSEQPSTMELPIVLSDTDARRVADVLLYDGWLGRNRRTWATTRAYSHLEPADIVALESDESTTYEVRITSLRLNGGLIEFEGVDEDAAVYDQTSLGGTIDDEAPLTIPGPTKMVLLDLPALLDADDDAGYYAAATGYLSTWPGARAYRSDDSGATYSSMTIFPDAAVIGTVATALGNHTGGNFYDAKNTITVALLGGATLTSVTDAQVLGTANAAAIGSEANGWEIVQFRDATLVSGNTYRLSTLLRGRRGTEHKQSTHVADEWFVLLTTAGLQRIPDSVAALNTARLYRAVTYGQSIANVNPQSFTNTGLALECYSPVHAHATGWGGDLTIGWIRRARIVNEWIDGIEVPLGEDSESYEVDIYDAGNTTVLRTLTSATESVAYSSANQTTDFGAPVSSLNVRIYQLSADVGRGIPCIATLT